MSEVTITYCVPCRYLFKAMQDADAILRAYGERLSALRIVPGDNGVYDVALDGEVLFSLDQAEHFPETEHLVAMIGARLPAQGKTPHPVANGA